MTEVIKGVKTVSQIKNYPIQVKIFSRTLNNIINNKNWDVQELHNKLLQPVKEGRNVGRKRWREGIVNDDQIQSQNVNMASTSTISSLDDSVTSLPPPPPPTIHANSFLPPS